MPKKSSAPTSWSTVRKSEKADVVQVSLNLSVNVPDELMLADVLQSAIVKQIQAAKLPLEPGTYSLQALVTLTK